MKYSELVSAFEAYTGVVGEIDDADLAIWFNEAQLDLSLDFGTVKKATLTPDGSGVLSPPADNIKILDVLVNGESADFSWSSAGEMWVGTDQDVQVVYRAMPDPAHVFTGIDQDQTPDLPYPIHYLLAIFATAMYWDRESEGDTEEMNLANKWLARYNAAKRNFLSKMNQTGGYVDRWTVIP